MHVLAIAGSLRVASYNRGLLRAAQEVALEGIQVELWDHLAAIPPYNADVEAQGDPEPVAFFKAAIRAADALLIATPEYNWGVPGVLKNALDWASRPALGSPLTGKLVGIVGASTGQGGTAKAQTQLRDALGFPRARVLAGDAIQVAEVYRQFDADGNLVDDALRRRLQALLERLREGWQRDEIGDPTLRRGSGDPPE
jgi:chromate reductase